VVHSVGLEDLSGVADFAVALATLAGVAWAVVQYGHRPKLFCGVPPSRTEVEAKGFKHRKVGVPALAGAFRHDSRTLARRLRRGRRKRAPSRLDERRCRDPLRCRSVSRPPDGRVGLPIVFVNRGGRAAPNYIADVALYTKHYGPGLHIRDVFTEGLSFGVYAAEPERLTDHARETAESATPRPVVEDYVSYMGEGIGRYGDWVFLWGALSASSYELIHLDLDVAADIDHFYVVYFLDSADAWMRAKHFIQRVDVMPAQ
jgi:hypothetical protein